MIFEHRTFTLAKDVLHPEANQDAIAVDAQRGLASLADGVSSSLFAGSWARILSQAIVADPPRLSHAGELQTWLDRQRQTWREPIDADKLAWHQKPKLAAGAFSTLLWLQLHPVSQAGADATGTLRLTAHAIGDGCLFQVRGDQVLRAFPIEDSRLFNEDPAVIGSVDRQPGHSLDFTMLQDDCYGGDLLVLCSDAIAAWALRQLESGENPRWETQWQMTPDDWAGWVQILRAARQIRYDDSTVLMLRVHPPDVSRQTAPSTSVWGDKVQQKLRPAIDWLGDRLGQ